jgi:ribonuclease P/MRP protein subunit POP8
VTNFAGFDVKFEPLLFGEADDGWDEPSLEALAETFTLLFIYNTQCDDNPTFLSEKISMMQEPKEDTSTNAVPSSKRKQRQPKGHEITTKTIKTPPFSYAWLELISESTTETRLDEITIRSYLTAAFTQFLGISGSAISVDILKVEGEECWLRIPREDLNPALAAVGGWIGGRDGESKVGWRVKGRGNWLSSLVGKQGVEKIWSG